ncbi:2-phosphosulfolactate phosphatase [Candidatus Bathyarchaeota archaeon]|nr:2-phosphosulfolactate phosphatase [Candidatus Bathyarchaeota archaeon]
MIINRLSLIEGAKKAEGVTVIIDVFRAFTTAAYVMANGAEKIIALSGIEEALELKKKHPNWIFIGENHGIKIDEFDYGNSPADVENIDFTSRVIVLRTSSGTQGINLAKNADEIILGSFVTAKPIINYLSRNNFKEISLVAMGWEGARKTIEDELCAKYIEDSLNNKNYNFEKIKNEIKKDPEGAKFFKKEQNIFKEKDFHLAMNIDKFNFILKVSDEKKGEIKKIIIPKLF